MKKISLLTITLILFSFHSYSQWGIKAGINGSTLSGSVDPSYLISGHLGVTYDVHLSGNWHFQPEFLFTTVGERIKDDGIAMKDSYVKIYAMEAPLNLSYRPTIGNNTKLLFDLGLYMRLGLFGDRVYKYYNSPTIDNSPFDGYNRFDTGLNLGLGLEKKQYYGLISLQRGLSYGDKNDNYHVVYRLSLGYRFKN